MSDKKNVLTNGIFKENPIFVLQIGLCSVLAITTSLVNALGMGLSVIFVLVLSNVIVSLIRNITPEEIRLPVYIVIIAALVTIVQMFLHAYVYSIYEALGSFLGLIVVNCIILGRAEAFARNNNVWDSFLDGLSMGLGYLVVLIAISFIRQLLSQGVIELLNPLDSSVIFSLKVIPDEYTLSIFGRPAGAFLTFAFLLGINNHFKIEQEKKAQAKAKEEAKLARKAGSAA